MSWPALADADGTQPSTSAPNLLNTSNVASQSRGVRLPAIGSRPHASGSRPHAPGIVRQRHLATAGSGSVGSDDELDAASCSKTDNSSTSDACESSEPDEAAGGLAIIRQRTVDLRSDSGMLLAPGGAVFINRRDVQQMYNDESITIFCSTWNLAGKVPDVPTIRHWLREKLTPEIEVDIYAMSLQEVHSYHMCFHHDVTSRIHETLGSRYTPYLWVRKFGQMLLVYVKKNLVPFCTDPDWEFIPSTVVAKPARTKGAIAVGFRVLHTSVLFIGCHLSHSNKGDRVRDYHKISQCFQFSRYIRRTGYSAVGSFDRVFWFGDLNFRMTNKNIITALIKGQGAVNDALIHDQLNVEMTQGTVFERFNEAPIHFQPTYKYRIGTSEDRILFRCNQANLDSIRVLLYDSVPEITLSDHKPVIGLFKMRVVHANKT